MRKSINILDICLTLIVALGMVFSTNYFETGSAHVSVHLLCLVLVVTAVFLAIFYWLQNRLSVGHLTTTQSHWGQRWQAMWHFVLKQQHLVLATALVIFLCWLIPLIFLYPGSLANDGWGQLAEFQATFAGGHIHRHMMSDHHPFMDTMFMGSVITPFGHFHHWQLGFFVFVLIQAVLTAFAFGWTIWFTKERLHLKEQSQRRLLLIYCFWPVFSTTVGSISKDTIFSWVYVLFMVVYADIVLTKGEDLEHKSWLWSLFVAGIGCIFTKKLGIYVVALSLLLLCLVIKKYRKRLITFSIATLLVAEVILHIGTIGLGIAPGGKQEMFSIPFQQTARCVKEHPDSLRGHDRKIVNAVLPVKDLAKRYNPVNADPVKGFNDRGTTSGFLAYLKVWAKMGLRYPKSYLAATNAMLSGWFSLYVYQPLMNMYNHNQLPFHLSIDQHAADRHGWPHKTANFAENLYMDLYKFPLFTFFLTYGFYASVLPLLLTCLTLKDRIKTHWLILVPMILSIVLGCWLSPVSAQTTEGMRYLIPVIYTLPLMMIITKFLWTSRSKSN